MGEEIIDAFEQQIRAISKYKEQHSHKIYSISRDGVCMPIDCEGFLIELDDEKGLLVELRDNSLDVWSHPSKQISISPRGGNVVSIYNRKV